MAMSRHRDESSPGSTVNSVLPIYLTFDDGPDPEWTPRILDVLADVQARATFFAIGAQVRRAPTIARRIADEGHALGNHTLSHRHPWAMPERAARAEVRDGAEALEDAIGAAPLFFRPPHGRRRACMTAEAEALGERVIMWDVSAIDWGLLSAPRAIEGRLARVKAHDIVLMHDGRNRHNRPDRLLTVLPAFLQQLKHRGLHPAKPAHRPTGQSASW
jgi:peptidoglycan-N-acetylglucosamine deacetylase